MRILAFAASNSSTSINKALVTHACARFKAELDSSAEIDLLDLNDFEMPIYSKDREDESGIPALARAFLSKIESADAILVSFAEHNGYVSAAWKNIFDWMSRVQGDVYQNKPMVIMATSGGKRGGANVLATQRETIPFFNGEVRAALSIGAWGEAFDAQEGRLVRPDDIAALGAALAKLA